ARSREPLGQVLQAQRGAVLARRVRRVEELVEVVGDALSLELPPERLRAEVDEELVALAAVDVDRAQRAPGIASLPRHPPTPPRRTSPVSASSGSCTVPSSSAE